MFKTKITLVSRDWETIHKYKSRIKPNEGEYIYLPEYESYFKIVQVIHDFRKGENLVLVVDKIKSEDI